jgi:hypothetical protein
LKEQRISYPVAFHAALSVVLLVARHAHNFLVTWDETLCSDWLTAYLAAEALFVPLLTLVLVLLHSCKRTIALVTTFILLYKIIILQNANLIVVITCAKDVSASIAFWSEVIVMAIGTVEFLVL